MTEKVSSGKEVPAWPATSLAERLIHCRVMLYQHGILTDAEKDRADARIDKLIAKEKARG
jgi:hypothetical protein